ncbi:histamine H1 receptor [Ctenodactylus gundi]
MILPNSSSSQWTDNMCVGNRTAMGRLQAVPLVAVLGSVSLVTVALNLLVLCALRCERKLHTVGNLYIVSLSVADLLVGAVVMPLAIVYLPADRWPLGRPLCFFWLSVDYVASTASIFSVFILCVDRYRSVQQPLRYLRYRTRARATATILGAWLLALLWVIPILGWHHFQGGSPGRRQERCETDFYHVTWFKIMTAMVNFYVPTSIMLWFYVKIYRAVRRHYQHRQIVSGSLSCFSELRLRPENPREDSRRLGKESPQEDPKKPPHNAREEPIPVPPAQDPREVKSAVVLSPEEEGEASGLSCYSPDVAGGGDRGSEAMACTESQPGTWEQSQEPGGRGTVSEEPTPVDSQSLSRATDSDLGAGPGFSLGLGHLRVTWQRLRAHSRQYTSGLHLSREWKAAKQLGCIMAAFILCWVPYFIFFMVVAFCKSCCSERAHTVTIWLGYLNSTLNPLIYPLCNETFRQTFRRLLHLRP